MQKPRRDTLRGSGKFDAACRTLQQDIIGFILLFWLCRSPTCGKASPVSNEAEIFRLSQSHHEILHLLLIGAEVSAGEYDFMLMNL
jgi:hypothetical protein